MQVAERGFGHQGFPIDPHAAHRFGHPGGVASEKIVVFCGAQMAYQSQFDDKLVHQFLNFFFPAKASLQIALKIDVQEGGGPAQGIGGAVIFLDSCQIGHI